MPTITINRDRCLKHGANHRSESTTITPGLRDLSVVSGTREHAAEPIHVGIEQILTMRVGCWQPPVYVSTC